jgi:hypothetical protein
VTLCWLVLRRSGTSVHNVRDLDFAGWLLRIHDRVVGFGCPAGGYASAGPVGARSGFFVHDVLLAAALDVSPELPVWLSVTKGPGLNCYQASRSEPPFVTGSMLLQLQRGVEPSVSAGSV